MSRRRFTERQVIETLIRQGAVIHSYRSKELITLENVGSIEREHIHEVALGGPDVPSNCVYSLKAEHAVITNGNGATTANSSKGKIAKAKRMEKARLALTVSSPEFRDAQKIITRDMRKFLGEPKRTWPKGRKLESRPFQKRPVRK